MTETFLVIQCVAGVVAAVWGPAPASDALTILSDQRQAAERYAAEHPGVDVGVDYTVPAKDGDVPAVLDAARDACLRREMESPRSGR